jgi:hypothetical protein
MGGGNAQKSATARERNLLKNAPSKGSQLKGNAASQSIICQICRSTFICTSTESKLKEHSDAKHPKNEFAACFPQFSAAT